MTGRERVKRAVKFKGPDRIPFFLPEPWGSDFTWVNVDPSPYFKPKVEGEDEYHCVWEKLPDDKTKGQVKVHPLGDYKKFNEFDFPDYNIPERYDKAKENVKNNKDDKFVIAGIPLSFIHRLEYLRGHIEAWTDPYDHPKELEKLLDRLADDVIVSIQNLAKVGIDGIMAWDDWGLQDRPMVSPAVFKEFFKPRYKRVYSEAHKHGIMTFLHSCGNISELLDDFIDAELDLIQMDQQENMGVENLAKRFGGRICFWCPVDIQQTMINGSIDDVRNYAKKLIYNFGKFNGGFIAGWYASPEAVGHTQEKINAMAESFSKHGKYPLDIKL